MDKRITVVVTSCGRHDLLKQTLESLIKSCSILTTTPNAVTSPVHDRMPVILDRDNYDLWLHPGMSNIEALSNLLKPFDSLAMRCYPVSARVNHVANDDEGCSMPVEHPAHQGRLF
jgi:putative SOS response-associated peptidase YedK